MNRGGGNEQVLGLLGFDWLWGERLLWYNKKALNRNKKKDIRKMTYERKDMCDLAKIMSAASTVVLMLYSRVLLSKACQQLGLLFAYSQY